MAPICGVRIQLIHGFPEDAFIQDVDLSLSVCCNFAVVSPSGQYTEFTDAIPWDDIIDHAFFILGTRNVVYDGQSAEDFQTVENIFIRNIRNLEETLNNRFRTALEKDDSNLRPRYRFLRQRYLPRRAHFLDRTF